MSINTLTHTKDGQNAHLNIGCDSITGLTGTFTEVIGLTGTFTNMTVTNLTATNITNPTFSDAILSSGGSVTTGDLIQYADTTGLLASDSGILATNVALLSSPMVVPKYNMVGAGPTYTNSTGATGLLGTTHVGSLTLATGTIHIGDTVKFHSSLFVTSVDSSSVLQLDLLDNGVSGWTGIFSRGLTATNVTILVDIELTNVDNTNSFLSSQLSYGLIGSNTFFSETESASVPLNTAISNTFSLQGIWNVASTGNVVNCRTFRIDLEQF